MRKYLIGALVGIVLSISATTYAADITTLIGKAVQGVFPVTVNGDVLPKTAIVIDGTSYLPVRAIGDAIGYDVSFNADLGIELKKKEVVPMTSATPSPTVSVITTPSATIPFEQTMTLESLNSGIDTYTKQIEIFEQSEKVYESNGDTVRANKTKETVDKLKATLADFEQKKAALPK